MYNMLKGPTLRELTVEIGAGRLFMVTRDIDTTPNLNVLEWVFKPLLEEEYPKLRKIVTSVAKACPLLCYIGIKVESASHESAVQTAERIRRQLLPWIREIGTTSCNVDLTRVRKLIEFE